MKSLCQRALCLVLILCLLIPVLTACGKREPVYLNSFTRVFDASNTLQDLQSYTYNEFGQVLTFTSNTRRITNTYDDRGHQLVTRTETLQDGVVTSIVETRMTYDKKGNAVTSDRYRMDGDTETHLGGVTMEYDKKNRLLRETGAQTVTEYVYAENDSYTSTETLTETGEVICVVTVTRNEAGQITSRITDRRDGGDTETYTAVYNENGDILTECYTLNGTELESYRYEYDTHDDHTHLARIITLRGETEMERTVYGYDNNHNRTQSTVCTPEGAVKRTFIYEYTLTEIKKLSR